MTTLAQTSTMLSDESHASVVAEQFDDYRQQADACVFGMWAFLTSEVMFFGGVFATYLVYRCQYPDAFAAASRELDVRWGTINTFLLLTSSLTMALAVRAANLRQRWPAALAILATIVLGCGFLGIKFHEYAHKVHENLAPLLGLPFHYAAGGAGGGQLFLGLYFGMTGIHALHMIIGILILTFMLFEVLRRPDAAALRVEIVGLYWHFVDIVWIFLFPLLYLIGHTP